MLIFTVSKDSVFPAADGQAESAPRQEPAAGAAAAAPPAHEQTTLVHNEAEEFALEPIDVTSVQGLSKKLKIGSIMWALMIHFGAKILLILSPVFD